MPIHWTTETPSENLPDEVREAVERAKNQITLDEAESLRLRNLADSAEHAANESHKRKVELDEQIAKGEAFLEKLNKDISDLETTLNTMRVEQADLNRSNEEKRSEMSVLNVDLAELARQKALVEDEISAKQLDFEKKLIDFNAKDSALDEKVKKMSDFLDSLR